MKKIRVAIRNGIDWEYVLFDLDELQREGEIQTHSDIGWKAIIKFEPENT